MKRDVIVCIIEYVMIEYVMIEYVMIEYPGRCPGLG